MREKRLAGMFGRPFAVKIVWKGIKSKLYLQSYTWLVIWKSERGDVFHSLVLLTQTPEWGHLSG